MYKTEKGSERLQTMIVSRRITVNQALPRGLGFPASNQFLEGLQNFVALSGD